MDYRVAEFKKYRKSGGMGDWDNGVLTIELPEWKEFHNVITILLDNGDFIWRGQAQDWPLKSKFDRVSKSSDREAKLQSHSDTFVGAIRGRRGNNPPELDNLEKVWSLGQHFGCATPLLDWTESPFVAAYFAFEEVLNNTSPRFIYGLSKDIHRWGPADRKGDKLSGYFIKFVEPDSDENPRLLNQRGLFTMPLSAEIEVKKTVEWCYAKDTEKGRSRIIFVKIQIPEIEREICLRNLNRMNINHATLFPDLMGASKYCNMKLEIANY